MELRKEWLETVLKRDATEKSVARVISVEKEDVVDKGDNYGSDICRLKMETVLGSGRIVDRSLIVKRIPSTELRAKQVGQWGIFRKEIKMYQTVLPNMNDLMASFGDKSETLWGQCLFTRPYDMLIIEDLKVQGFKMADRMEGLDMNHALLVIRNLGKYHAMSAVLHDRGNLQVGEFTSNLMTSDQELMGTYLDQALTIFADVIETTWEPEWKTYAVKMRNFIGKTTSAFKEMFDEKTCKFPVLNHGDFWINNMMFKYNDVETGTPSSMRFVDFQMAFYNSYAYDLVYFLSSSIRAEIRDDDYGCLLSEYHSSLTSNLRKFGYSGDNVPTLEDVVEEFKSKSLYGLTMAAMMLPFVFAQPEDAPDIEQLLKELDVKGAQVDPKPMLGKKFTRAAKSLLALCQRQGVFDKL